MAVPVSTTWKDAIQAQFRYPAYLKVTITVTPPGIREGAQVSADNSEAITSVSKVIDGVSKNIAPIATFEPQRWLGDGSMYLPSSNASENLAVEWWNNDCTFSTVTLNFVFDQPYTIPGMYCIWDTETNSWPTDLLVSGYDINGTLLQSVSVTNIESSSGYFDAPFSGVKSVTMQINKWSKTNWRARITEVLFGLFIGFNPDTIIQASLSAKCDLLSGSLPTLGLNFTASNYDRKFDPTLATGYAKYFAVRQKAEVTWGFETSPGVTEWLDPWPLYLSAWTIPADELTLSVSMQSRLQFLTQKFTAGTYTGASVSLKTLSLGILNNSNILKSDDSETPWELDDVLDTLYTRAPLPEGAANVLLQLISNAAGCVLDSNPINNYVRIRKSCADSGYTITTLQQVGDPAFTIADQLKSVSVKLYSYTQAASASTVYTYNGTVAANQTFNITLATSGAVLNPSATITNGTIVSQTYYSKNAVIVVTPTDVNTAVTLTVTGTVVTLTTSDIVTYTNDDIASGLEINVDNQLVTEMDTVNYLGNIIKNMYLRRKDVQVNYTGYPELETGDKASFTTNYGDFDADLYELALTFNGGFSGKILAKMREAT